MGIHSGNVRRELYAAHDAARAAIAAFDKELVTIWSGGNGDG
jgi:hypothetical protein